MKLKVHMIVNSSILFILMIFIFADSFDILAAQSSNSVNLTWIDNSNDELGFYIERATGTGSFSQIGAVSANVVQYTDSNVSLSTTYSYRISAYNSFGQSAYSNTIQVAIPSGTTTPIVPPSGGSSGGSSGGGGGGSSGGGSSGSSSGSSSGLTGSVIENTPNDDPSNSDLDVSNEPSESITLVAGRAIDGDSDALKELSPLAVYVLIAILLGITFFILVRKYMKND